MVIFPSSFSRATVDSLWNQNLSVIGSPMTSKSQKWDLPTLIVATIWIRSRMIFGLTEMILKVKQIISLNSELDWSQKSSVRKKENNSMLKQQKILKREKF